MLWSAQWSPMDAAPCTNSFGGAYGLEPLGANCGHLFFLVCFECCQLTILSWALIYTKFSINYFPFKWTNTKNKIMGHVLASTCGDEFLYISCSFARLLCRFVAPVQWVHIWWSVIFETSRAWIILLGIWFDLLCYRPRHVKMLNQEAIDISYATSFRIPMRAEYIRIKEKQTNYCRAKNYSLHFKLQVDLIFLHQICYVSKHNEIYSKFGVPEK